MDPIQHHYDSLLAEVYTWMFGGFEARVAVNEALFERLNLQPTGSKLAIDIGCGSGFQTVPLLQRGFAVDAIDISNVLTDELRRNADHAQKLNVCVMDGLDYLRSTATAPPANVLVCMGDTLVHFPSRDYVRHFLSAARVRLATGGTLILTVRNYTRTLHGGDCVIPIRLTDTRLLTCVLDYADETIRVTDMLYERNAAGVWGTRKNTYTKLRLLPGEISAALVSAGFMLREQSEVNGLVTFVAE
jgi:hypothetical protein